MPDFDRLWFQSNLNQAGIQNAQAAITETGRALPCRVTAVTGALVTVSFEVDASPRILPPITIPQAQSPWMISPTQVGDFGVTFPCDAYLNVVASTGAGIPTLDAPANLSALVFLPVTNALKPPALPNTAYVQGPAGVTVQATAGNKASIVLNDSSITLTFGSVSMVIDASGVTINGTETVTGNATIAGISFNSHVHGGVQSGGSNTSGPQS